MTNTIVFTWNLEVVPPMLFFYCEFIPAFVAVHFSWPQHTVWKVWLKTKQNLSLYLKYCNVYQSSDQQNEVVHAIELPQLVILH